MILRRIARPMLAAVFVSGGIETLRNPKPRVDAADPIVSKAADQVIDKLPEEALNRVPDSVIDKVPTDTESLVKLNAAVQVGAGLALALGRFPRLSALLLAGSTIPTTLTGHRFWEADDPNERTRQKVQFLKNLGLLGGLLIAAADTHGKPSVAWLAKHAVSGAADSVQGTFRDATGAIQGTAKDVAGSVQGAARAAAGSVQGAARGAAGTVKGAASAVLPG